MRDAIQQWAGYWHRRYFREGKRWLWWVGQIPAWPGMVAYRLWGEE